LRSDHSLLAVVVSLLSPSLYRFPIVVFKTLSRMLGLVIRQVEKKKFMFAFNNEMEENVSQPWQG
jgi:hypothetical protein